MSIQITTEQIKGLRDMTGISVMQCKRALEEAEGDIKKALAILKKTSSDIALKKLIVKLKTEKFALKQETCLQPAQAGRRQVKKQSWCLCAVRPILSPEMKTSLSCWKILRKKR